MSEITLIEVDSAANPSVAVIWMHGLGADGSDFEPIVPELGLADVPAVRFIFPNAPYRPVTCNGGYVMRAWYDIISLEPDSRKIDEAGLLESREIVRKLIQREVQRGIPSQRIFLAGFSQGGAVAYLAALTHPDPLAGVIALSTYIPEARLITAELQFIEAGGYADPVHWLAEGWDWRLAENRRQPLYWQRPGDWQEFTLGGLVPLDRQRPVVHVSYYEADAYARRAEARLPTEAEWENAAARLPVAGHFAARREFHPAAAVADGLAQLFGDAWEWTRSSYEPYPGFRAGAGAVGEYNGKFMVNQYVLRGGSCVTPDAHVRASYRNFFPASACWQFSGIRLARDVERAGNRG